jgi:hypothetical protein
MVAVNCGNIMKLRTSLFIVLLLLPLIAHAAELPEPTRAFINAHCIDCHGAENKKGGLNFDALTTQLDNAAIEAKWTLAFDRVQRGEMPPPSETKPPAPEHEAYMKSLGDFLRQHDLARKAPTGRVVLRRLNRVEYENTLHDLLAIDIPLANMLPEDASSRGFDNVSEGLRLSSGQIESYLQAADTALDAAINFRPQPVVKKKHLSYLEMPKVKEQLAKPTGSINKDGGRYHQIFRSLPDALVIFPNETYGGTNLNDSRADVAGLYRVRLSAYAYQSTGQPTVVAKLIGQNYNPNRTRVAAAFDLPLDKPRVAEISLRMEEGEFFYMSGAGCDFSPDGKHVQDIGGEKYTGSGMAIQWLEFEGPLFESWPPPSVRRVFGDLPTKPIVKPKKREVAYEIVSTNPTAEADKLVANFARMAFRRPVTEKDTAPFIQLAHEAISEGGSLETALRRGFKAILVSPEFLFLQETPGKLDDYALASRLSYFLWSSMPDDELLKLAADGKLRDSATLRQQTERLLSSPKSQAFTQNFCGQWLNIRAIDATTPDRTLYPEFDGLLQTAMVDETESFFNELLRKDLGVAMLIDSDFAMLNRRIAEHYGIPGVVGEEFRKVALPAGSHRGGLLTQASILKVTANGTLSSPVVRGAWVMKRILGREPQPPPADAGSIEPDTRGTTTIREQLEKHRRSASCAACHKYMDPPGFALESYDVIGGWRDFYRTQGKGKDVLNPLTKKRAEYRLGSPVDASGTLADGRVFSNLDQLKKLLLEQQESIARNLVNNLVAYSTGAGVTFSDRARVEEILQRAKPRAYGIRTMVHEVVQSELFQSK